MRPASCSASRGVQAPSCCLVALPVPWTVTDTVARSARRRWASSAPLRWAISERLSARRALRLAIWRSGRGLAQRSQQRGALGAGVGELVGGRDGLRGDVGGALAQCADVGELGELGERVVETRGRDPQRERGLAAAVAGGDVGALDVAAGGLGRAHDAVGGLLDVVGLGGEREVGGALDLAVRLSRRGDRGGERGGALRGVGAARAERFGGRLLGRARRAHDAPGRGGARRVVVGAAPACGRDEDHERDDRGEPEAGRQDLRRAQADVPWRLARAAALRRCGLAREARVDASIQRRQERGARLGPGGFDVGDQQREVGVGGRLVGQRRVELAQAAENLGIGQGVTTAHGRPSGVG